MDVKYATVVNNLLDETRSWGVAGPVEKLDYGTYRITFTAGVGGAALVATAQGKDTAASRITIERVPDDDRQIIVHTRNTLDEVVDADFSVLACQARHGEARPV